MTRVTLQLRNSDHSLIRYQDEGDRNFAPNPKHAKSAPQSLKILSGVDYDLTVELRDDGNCIDSLLGIKLDDALLEVLHEQGHSSTTIVPSTRCAAMGLSALHFGPTPMVCVMRCRSSCLSHLVRSTARADCSASSTTDIGQSASQRQARQALLCATCSFDAAKTQNTAAAQQWTFEEVEDRPACPARVLSRRTARRHYR